MVVYCLENKRTATSFAEIEKEIQSLMGKGFNPHPDFFFRRLPLKAFSLPREALWCLIYFHQGRNKNTGLYYSRRTLQTQGGKPFRIGETIRLLEKEGYLIKRSAWGWFVPQEDAQTGLKYPAFRGSFFDTFLENPTKERRIALRFLLHLALLKGAKVTYRSIQSALGCSTDLARALARFYDGQQLGCLSPSRVQNRVFNWSKEAPKSVASNSEESPIELRPRRASNSEKDPIKRAENAPNPDMKTPLNEPKKAVLCAESGVQYKGLNKEIHKKNPSTRPMAGSKSQEGFSVSIKKIRLSDLGFETGETLAAKADHETKALEPYRSQFESEEAYKALEILFAWARLKAPCQDKAPDLLAMFIVDIWLEMLRNKSGFKTSVLGYFFTALRNNLTSGYCRMGQKKEAQERRQQVQAEEARKRLAGTLRDIEDQTRKQIHARCVQKYPGFHQIPIREWESKMALIQDCFEELKGRGDLAPMEAALYEFCEARQGNRENILRFVDANPDLWKAYCQARTMRKAAA